MKWKYFRPGLSAFAIVAISASPLPGVEPSWWAAPATRIFVGGSYTPNDWAPVNVGQLKHVATMAKAYLDQHLGLFQSDWNEAFAPATCPLPFTSGPAPENAAPANVGQLKFLAQGFYRILAAKAPNYNVRAGLIHVGLSPWGLAISKPVMPWSEINLPEENYAPINIGQLKLVFSFDLTYDLSTIDPDLIGADDSEDDALSAAVEYFAGPSANPGGFDASAQVQSWAENTVLNARISEAGGGSLLIVLPDRGPFLASEPRLDLRQM